MCRELGGVAILQKGAVDLISDGEHLLRCDVEGGPRRSGGLGDILAGTLGIVYAWAAMAAAADKRERDGSAEDASAGQEHLWAALAACSIARSSCRSAFAREKRATTVRTLAKSATGARKLGCPLFGQGALDKCLQVAPWLAAACALALARAHKERHSFDSFLRPNSWTSKLRWSSCVSVYRRLCTCSRNSEVCLNGTALRRPRHRFSASDIMRPAICKISDRLEFSVGTIR